MVDNTVETLAFVPEMTTDSICVGENTDLCLTDHLETMEANINDKAAGSHTHTPASIGAAAASHSHDYAAPDHTHTASSIGAAEANHSHDYAAGNHTHTPASIGAAAADHSHNYAAPTHTHTQSEVADLETALAAKADASVLNTKADLVNGKIPSSQLPGFVDDVLEYAAVANFPATGEAGKIYVATGENKTYRWSGTGYVEISQGVALGETSATAYRGDRGKTAYDHSQNGTVHVTAAQKTAWDSKAAGDHAHSYNDLTDKPTIPTIPSSLPANGGNADTVDGKHASDFATAAHTHSYAASNHTHTPSSIGAAASNHGHSYNSLTDKPTIPTTLPANGGNADTVDNKHASYFAAASHTHTAADVGAAAASHSHSEYAASNHGHSGYASTSHTHTASEVGAVPASGGTATNLTVTPYLYTAQILPKDSGSYSIGSSDNRYYSTYLRVNPNVSSDLRCKRDIVSMDIDALAAFVDKLCVVSYNYKDDAADEAKRIGLIAQEVVTADPTIAKGCIEQDEKGFYSLRAADLVFPLIAAVQALTKRVAELEGK